MMFFDGYYIIDILGIYGFIQLAYDSATSSLTVNIDKLNEYLNKIREADQGSGLNREYDEFLKDLERYKAEEEADSKLEDTPPPSPQLLGKLLGKLPRLSSRQSSRPFLLPPEPPRGRQGGKKNTLKKRRTRRSKSKQVKNKKTRRYKKTL